MKGQKSVVKGVSTLGMGVRIVLPLLAATATVWTVGPKALQRARDILGGDVPAVVRSMQIVCNTWNGQCVADVWASKMRDDCITQNVSFEGFADGVPFSGRVSGEPFSLGFTEGTFINFKLPMVLTGARDQLPDGVFPITNGGVELHCGAEFNYHIKFARITATVDGIDFTETLVELLRLEERL